MTQDENDIILLAHGSGGKLSHELVENRFLPFLSNPVLAKLDDSAVFEVGGRIAFTTDSYVVNPLFFPGGDIGKLAVCGTVNDLSMSGAVPLYMSLALIIEEGLPMKELEQVLQSIKATADETGTQIITGDTKVVSHGQADKLFINTAGIGIVPDDINVSGAGARIGDKIILSGTIGDHGIAIMSLREGLKFSVPVESDCQPLNKLVQQMLEVSSTIRCLRDPTRGGLATTLNEIATQSQKGIFINEAAVPVKEAVRAACELLGLDPLYIANEGKLVAVVESSEADKILASMKRNLCGKDAAIIGEITAEHAGKTIMKTRLGSSRMLDMLSGDLLPRIC